MLKSLAESGAAVLLISSELPELLNLCNRLYVARNGLLVAEYQAPNITERDVLESMLGVDPIGPDDDSSALKNPIQ